MEAGTISAGDSDVKGKVEISGTTEVTAEAVTTIGDDAVLEGSSGTTTGTAEAVTTGEDSGWVVEGRVDGCSTREVAEAGVTTRGDSEIAVAGKVEPGSTG